MPIRIIDNAVYSGRVGIGTNNPTSPLHIKVLGSGGSNIFSLENDSNKYDFRLSGSTLLIRDGSNDRVSVTSTGNVGIGTTSPQKKLDVYLGTASAVASIGGGISAGEYAGLHFGYSETGNSLYRHSAIVFERDDAAFGDARGNIHILNSPSGSASADLGDARLTILPAGNVGIGTTSPDANLEVESAS